MTREVVTASPIWTDAQRDIAVLKIARALPVAAELRTRPVSVGEGIVVFGFPLSGVLSSEGVFSTGIVAATSGIQDDITELQISAAIQPGNSGGPLLDEFGALAGLVVSKLDASRMYQLTGSIPESINFAIKADVLRLLLDTYGVRYASSIPANRLSTRELAEKAKRIAMPVVCY